MGREGLGGHGAKEKKGERIEKKEWVIDDELEKNKDKKKYSHHL